MHISLFTVGSTYTQDCTRMLLLDIFLESICINCIFVCVYRGGNAFEPLALFFQFLILTHKCYILQWVILCFRGKH